MTDRVEEGLVFLDEALAAACAGEMTEVTTVDGLFCGFFWACELVNDVPRADQWMRAAADLMNRRNVVAAFCRAHYGGILTAAGRWEEAETELLAASSRFERGVSTRREAALIRLGDLRVRQGRLEEAAQLLTGLEAHPDAVRALAGLYFARGEAARARDVLERATAGPDDAVPQVGESTMVGPLLALLVDVHLAEGSIDAAAQAAVRLRPHRPRAGRRIPASRGRPRGGAGVHRERAGRCPRVPARRPGGLCPGAVADGAREHALGDGPVARRKLTRRRRSPRRSRRSRASSDSRPPGTRTRPPRCCDRSARRPGRDRRESARSPSGSPKCSSSSARGCRIPRSQTGSTSRARRSSTTSARVLAKLGLRNRAEAAAFAAREKIRP